MATRPLATEQKRLVPTSAVAVRLGLAPDTVRKLAAEGKIPAIRFGTRSFWRFDPEEVEAAIQRAKR